MKKKSLAFLRNANQEQPTPVGIHALTEQQQQAKSGLISLVNGEEGIDENVKAVGQSAPVRESVGTLIVDANRAYAPESVSVGVLTNDLANRKVVILDAAATADTIDGVSSGAGMVKSAELTFDGGESKNAPMSNAVANGTGLATAINAKLAAAKPSFSMAGIINTIEDVILADGTKDAVVIVNQVANKVLVYTGTPAQVAGAIVTLGAGYDKLGNFEQNAMPQAAATGQFGE